MWWTHTNLCPLLHHRFEDGMHVAARDAILNTRLRKAQYKLWIVSFWPYLLTESENRNTVYIFIVLTQESHGINVVPLPLPLNAKCYLFNIRLLFQPFLCTWAVYTGVSKALLLRSGK